MRNRTAARARGRKADVLEAGRLDLDQSRGYRRTRGLFHGEVRPRIANPYRWGSDLGRAPGNPRVRFRLRDALSGSAPLRAPQVPGSGSKEADVGRKAGGLECPIPEGC